LPLRLVVAEWGWPPDTRTATAAFGTTAPEGSVTWPRKVPDAADNGADDGADDCGGDCAHAGMESAISVAGNRIAEIRFAEIKTDKYFNTHLILSRQIKLIEDAD
jgi:hypothetical protein